MAEIRINATGGVKLYDADDSHYAQIVAGTITSNTDVMTLGHNVINIPMTTASSSATTGALTIGGGLGVAADLYVGDDTYLITDSAVLGFGADKDTLLTHTDGTGLTLNSTNKLCFNDASQFVQGSSATVLSIGATDEIDLTATAVDLNGTLNVSGVATFQAAPVFPNGSLDLLDLDIDGGTEIGAAIVDADLFIIDDGAGGTNRKCLASRLKTYAGGAALTGSTDNQVATVTGANAIAGEANLIFDGAKLGVSVTPSAQLHVERDSTSAWTGHIESTNSGNYARVLRLDMDTDFDDNSSVFLYCIGAADVKCTISADGDLQNADNSYGAISDERIKQDIRDSNSQWDDIKALRVRNFKRKDDVRKYGEAAWEQIGLVAQEVELVSPKLVEERIPDAGDILGDSAFGTLYEEGDVIPEDKEVGDVKTTTSERVKGMKYSVLYMKAIKALQEAQTRIETLEAKVAVLEG